MAGLVGDEFTLWEIAAVFTDHFGREVEAVSTDIQDDKTERLREGGADPPSKAGENPGDTSDTDREHKY